MPCSAFFNKDLRVPHHSWSNKSGIIFSDFSLYFSLVACSPFLYCATAFSLSLAAFAGALNFFFAVKPLTSPEMEVN